MFKDEGIIECNNRPYIVLKMHIHEREFSQFLKPFTLRNKGYS